MTARSDAERRFQTMLDSLKLSYVPLCPDFPPWELDIYLPEWHIDVEVDGPYHGPKRDARRDADLLERFGVVTLRIDDHELRTVEARANTIHVLLDFIEKHADTAADRKRIWLALRRK